MEKMYRVPQLQVLHRDVIEVLVELLDADDLVAQRLGARSVFFGGSGGHVFGRGLLAFFCPEEPFEAELGDAHGFEDGVEHGGAAGGRGGCGLFFGSGTGQVGGAEHREAVRHGGEVFVEEIEDAEELVFGFDR